jgi:hypothetical protein
VVDDVVEVERVHLTRVVMSEGLADVLDEICEPGLVVGAYERSRRSPVGLGVLQGCLAVADASRGTRVAKLLPQIIGL